MVGETGDDEIGVHRRQAFGRDLGARVQQHLEPLPETLAVELFGAPGRGSVPQMDVEHPPQLRRGGQRHDLDRRFQAAAIDDAVDELGGEARNHPRQVGSVEQAGNELLRFGHGDRGCYRARPEKNSLEGNRRPRENSSGW